jgi:hypothetical protein
MLSPGVWELPRLTPCRGDGLGGVQKRQPDFLRHELDLRQGGSSESSVGRRAQTFMSPRGLPNPTSGWAHIHCSGASRMKASNCLCMAAVPTTASPSRSLVSGIGMRFADRESDIWASERGPCVKWAGRSYGPGGLGKQSIAPERRKMEWGRRCRLEGQRGMQDSLPASPSSGAPAPSPGFLAKGGHRRCGCRSLRVAAST